MKKQYLLDTNIVIKLWKDYPNLLDKISKSEAADFKIPKLVAKELSEKEQRVFDGIPALTDRFLRLLPHIMEIDECSLDIEDDKAYNIKRLPGNNYSINGNKISESDYNLICICKLNNEFTLVTEDKKVLNSAKLMIDSTRVLNYREFIEDIDTII